MPTGVEIETASDAALSHERQPRVLLADDNVAARRLIAALIRQMGFDVQIAANGEEAMASVRDTGYDLIVLDIDMPEIDGLETARRIRAMNELGNGARIVAMSGYLNEFTDAPDWSDLFDATMPKPVTRFRLQEVLFGVLHKNASHCAYSPAS